MRKTAITVGLLVLSASTSVGCKSTPKLAWWKSNKTDETALAHAAPELPSDAAKKAEGAQVAGGAAPFKPANTTGSSSVAAKSGSGYPSTDAPAFTPNVVTQVAANTTPVVGSTTTAGAAGPYDPTATPAPKAPAPTVATTGNDRYGLGSSAANGSSAVSTTPLPTYGQAPSGVASDAPSYSPSTDLGSIASRYGTPPNNSTTPVAPATTSIASTYTPAPVMQASTAYRPGGTSSYNAVSADDVRVATRPESPTSTTPSTPVTTPTAPATTTAVVPATPASATPTTTAAPASANRYW